MCINGILPEARHSRPMLTLPLPDPGHQAAVLPAGTVLRAAVRDATGNVVYPVGTVLRQDTALAAGMVRALGAFDEAAREAETLSWSI